MTWSNIPIPKPVWSQPSLRISRGDQLAKGVVLEDDKGYVMAVVPSTHKIDMTILDRYLGRNLELATETELCQLFHDCEVGAIPPIGSALWL